MSGDNDNAEQLRRVDEDLTDVRVEMAGVKQEVKNLTEKVQTLVTRAEFTPVKLIVYGLATAIMTSVITALLAKVLVK